MSFFLLDSCVVRVSDTGAVACSLGTACVVAVVLADKLEATGNVAGMAFACGMRSDAGGGGTGGGGIPGGRGGA